MKLRERRARFVNTDSHPTWNDLIQSDLNPIFFTFSTPLSQHQTISLPTHDHEILTYDALITPSYNQARGCPPIIATQLLLTRSPVQLQSCGKWLSNNMFLLPKFTRILLITTTGSKVPPSSHFTLAQIGLSFTFMKISYSMPLQYSRLHSRAVSRKLLNGPCRFLKMTGTRLDA